MFCAQVHCPDNEREYTDKPTPDKVPSGRGRPTNPFTGMDATARSAYHCRAAAQPARAPIPTARQQAAAIGRKATADTHP
tara:strand:- start:7674 stop:7913 length:240 start_codon:yes stop_codon:yes gene_type:complete